MPRSLTSPACAPEPTVTVRGGPDHPAYGITASGRRATPYVSVAVDPSVIQLGADVLVDYGDGEIYYYRADDTGPKGNHIDLCVSSHEEALRLGVQTATVYWVED